MPFSKSIWAVSLKKALIYSNLTAKWVETNSTNNWKNSTEVVGFLSNWCSLLESLLACQAGFPKVSAPFYRPDVTVVSLTMVSKHWRLQQVAQITVSDTEIRVSWTWNLTSHFSTNMAISETKGQRWNEGRKEGQRYINLNPDRLFAQQQPEKGKVSRGTFKLLRPITGGENYHTARQN